MSVQYAGAINTIAFIDNVIIIIMAVASGPAGTVLAGPVFTFAFKIAHAQTIGKNQ